MIRTLSILTMLFGLTGCFIAEELLVPPPDPPPIPLENRVQTTIATYIQEKSPGETYLAHTYSEVAVIKTPELIRFEEIQEELQSPVNPDSVMLKKQADSLSTRIRKYDLGRKMKTTHFYTLSDTLGQLHIVRSVFFLNDALEVVKNIPEVLLTVDASYREILDFYINEHTLLYADTYSESRILSQDFYSFFKKRLDELTSVSARSEFLHHTLKLCNMAKNLHQFDQQLFLESLVVNYIKDDRKDIENYQYLDFSNLYEKSTEDKVDAEQTGYYFFINLVVRFGAFRIPMWFS